MPPKRNAKSSAKPRKRAAVDEPAAAAEPTPLPPIATVKSDDYDAVYDEFHRAPAGGAPDPFANELGVFELYRGDDAQRRVMAALRLAMRWTGYDGDHHKQWCLDQMVMALLGSEAAHKRWRLRYRGEPDEDGEYQYEKWDRGIPP